MTADTEPATGGRYDERLWVPWSWWVLGAVMGVLLGFPLVSTLWLGQVWVGWLWLTGGICVVVLVTGLLQLSLSRVYVADGVLYVAGERLPVAAMGELHPVDDATRRRLMGPEGDRRAHLATRGWVKTALLIEIVDPALRTPYWLVSTRRPAALAAALGRSLPAQRQGRPAR